MLQLCLLECPQALRPSKTLWDVTCVCSRSCLCLWSAEQLTQAALPKSEGRRYLWTCLTSPKALQVLHTAQNIYLQQGQLLQGRHEAAVRDVLQPQDCQLPQPAAHASDTRQAAVDHAGGSIAVQAQGLCSMPVATNYTGRDQQSESIAPRLAAWR